MKNTERIIRYLDGDLNQNEVEEFEQLLSTDNELACEVEFAKEVEHTLVDKQKNQFVHALQLVNQNYNKQEDKSILLHFVSRKTFYWAAAAVLIVFVSTFSFLQFNKFGSSSNCDEIFDQYYQTYQIDITTRSGESVVTNLQQAFQAYENKEFEQAVVMFNKVLAVDNTLIIVYFYKGIACIETKDYNQAILDLGKVLSQPSSPYYIQAHWYTALVMLKLNKPVSAKEHLIWLKNNDRFYGQKSDTILKSIE